MEEVIDGSICEPEAGGVVRSRPSPCKGEAFLHTSTPMANQFCGMLRPNAEAAKQPK